MFSPMICMDFPRIGKQNFELDLCLVLLQLPKTARQNDRIWVIVDRLTKSAHFLAMRETDPMEKYDQVYLEETIARHGVPLKIIFYCNNHFTSFFQASMYCELRSRIDLSTAYQPQIDGQTERTIQIVENILKVYEALYGRKCRTPLC